MPVGSTRRALNHNITPSETLTWDTATEWGNAQSQSLVTHLSPTGTDWPGTDTLSLVPGLPSDEGGTSLVSYWPHDTTDAVDIAGTNDGTITGATADQQGVLGFDAFSFDGTDDEIDVGNVDALEQQSAITIAGWVLFDSLSGNNSDDNKAIYTFGDDFDNWCDIHHQGPDGGSTNKFVMNFESGGTKVNAASTSTFDTTGQFFHVAGVFDANATDVGTLYVDGVQEATDGTSLSQTPSVSSTHRISQLSFQGDWELPGHICDVRVYNRALSQSEVQTLALQDSPTGSLVTPAKTSSAGLPTQLTTTTTIPANTSVDVVVHQDTNQDGTSDNSETVSLSGGTDETNSLTASNFTDDTDGADYWVDVQPSVTNPTDSAPTGSKLAVTVG